MRRTRPIWEYFIFNGKSSIDFGVKIQSGADTYKGASRKVETFEVIGRNGTLTRDEGTYENVTQPYECYLIDNFNWNLEAFRDFLNDGEYHRLEDTYHPEEYRLARYSGEFNPDINVIDESGSFDVEFDCKPQRFLKSGEKEVVIDGTATLQNPTNQIALPLIYVKSGTGTIKVNDTEFTVNINEGVTIIDSERQDCYLSNKVPVNSNVSIGDYPTLKKGANTIEVSDGMDVSIVPNWWRR